jgi:hypothetical protein
MKPKSTGLNATASAGGSSKSRSHDLPAAYPFFAICVEHGEYEPFLFIGKSYKVLKPLKNDPAYMFRIVDEEGEDYLYPRKWFVPVELKPKEMRRVATALTSAH